MERKDIHPQEEEISRKEEIQIIDEFRKLYHQCRERLQNFPKRNEIPQARREKLNKIIQEIDETVEEYERLQKESPPLLQGVFEKNRELEQTLRYFYRDLCRYYLGLLFEENRRDERVRKKLKPSKHTVIANAKDVKNKQRMDTLLDLISVDPAWLYDDWAKEMIMDRIEDQHFLSKHKGESLTRAIADEKRKYFAAPKPENREMINYLRDCRAKFASELKSKSSLLRRSRDFDESREWVFPKNIVGLWTALRDEGKLSRSYDLPSLTASKRKAFKQLLHREGLIMLGGFSPILVSKKRQL